MRILATLILAAGAVSASPDPGLTLTPLSGEVRVGPVSVVVAAPSPLADRQIVTTGAAGSASISGAGGWTATLAKLSSASVRTLPVRDGNRFVFRRALEVLSGQVTWKVTSESLLLLPGLRVRANAAQLRIYFFEGEVHGEVQDGEAIIEVEANGTMFKLTNGQKVLVRFNTDTNTFQVDVVEDNGEPIELLIGTTTIVGTKGDSFLARIDGDDLDVTVLKGLIQKTGPEGETEDVGAGTVVTVKGGAVGAAQGVGGDEGKKRKKRIHLKEPERRLDPVKDILDKRSDLSPAGLK